MSCRAGWCFQHAGELVRRISSSATTALAPLPAAPVESAVGRLVVRRAEGICDLRIVAPSWCPSRTQFPSSAKCVRGEEGRSSLKIKTLQTLLLPVLREAFGRYSSRQVSCYVAPPEP